MSTIKDALSSSRWWVGPGTYEPDYRGGPDRLVTWALYAPTGDGSRLVAEFDSKTLALHIAKLHNRAARAREVAA